MRRCVFKESIGRNAYTAYRLVANMSWYLALDKHGKPKRGPNTRVDMKSVHFIERPIGVKRNPSSLSERSRPRAYQSEDKQPRTKILSEKSVRAQPMLSDSMPIDSSTVNRYIEKLKSNKKELKKAIKALFRLKRKLSPKTENTKASMRAKPNTSFNAIFKRIISKLKLNAGIDS